MKQVRIGQAVVVAALALAAFVLAPASAGVATAQGNAPILTDTITVSGTGSASGSPDVVILEMGIELVGQDVGETLAQVNDTISAVVDALVAQGVAQEDIQTTGLSVWPEDRLDPASGMPSGERNYRVRNTVRFTLRDLDQVATVIDAGVGAGANTIYGITFDLSDPSALQSEARAAAFENARQRAQELADLAGVTLGDVVAVSEVYLYGIPAAEFGRGAGGGGSPVQQGQLTVNVQVQVTFGIAR